MIKALFTTISILGLGIASMLPCIANAGDSSNVLDSALPLRYADLNESTSQPEEIISKNKQDENSSSSVNDEAPTFPPDDVTKANKNNNDGMQD